MVSDLALSAYIASLRSSASLATAVYSQAATNIHHLETPLLLQWQESTGIEPPEVTQQNRQRAWDRAAASAVASKLLEDSADDTEKARLRAAGQPHSGAWLNVLPIASLGTLLDRETLRIAVALRVGAPACAPHRCRCGATVDTLGLHALSCQLSAGRLPRHAALNDIIKRSLHSAGMPSILEPAGLDRGDGRRPDGLTTFPFAEGRCLIWDSTCVDTYAGYIIHKSAAQAGAAAQGAENRKQRRYAELGRRFKFQPIAVETSGPLGQSTLPFLKELGRRIARETGDKREADYLFQRVSLAVVRGNATSLLMGSTSNAAPEASSDGDRSLEQDTTHTNLDAVGSCLATGSEAGSPPEQDAAPAHRRSAAGSLLATSVDGGHPPEQATAPAHHRSAANSSLATGADGGCPPEQDAAAAHHRSAADSSLATDADGGCSPEQDTALAHLSAASRLANGIDCLPELTGTATSPRPKDRLSEYEQIYMQMRAELTDRDPMSDPGLARYLRR